MKSWVEVSQSRLVGNLRALQAVAGDATEVLAVIKADGYGHGAALCAPVLRDAGAGWLGVTDVEEGLAVRASLAEDRSHAFTRVLIMCGMAQGDAELAVASDLTPVVWTLDHLNEVETAAKAAGHRVRVHLEVDCGMSRQGAGMGELLRLAVEKLAASPWLVCEGVMTHLPSAEVAGAQSTERALERFARAVNLLRESGLQPDFLHVGNSSAVDEDSTTQWLRQRYGESGSRLMVRTGIALYGYCLELQETANRARREGDAGRDAVHVGLLRPRVRPVMSWKAPVIDVRDVEAGATVGYGSSFVAEVAMRLALLPVGYADGFRREASSGLGDGWVMIADQRASVVGRVSMNLTVVDVTGIDGVTEGTEAVLLGEGVTAEDHALWAETIPYDILCGVRGRRVLR